MDETENTIATLTAQVAELQQELAERNLVCEQLQNALRVVTVQRDNWRRELAEVEIRMSGTEAAWEDIEAIMMGEGGDDE